MALTVLASLICVLPALAALICVLSTLAALICILAALVWVLSHRLRRSVCLLILSLVHSLTLVHALALVHALILIHPLALIHALALIHSLALIQPLALIRALVLIHSLTLVFRIRLLSIYGSALLSCVLRLSLFTLIAVFTCCFFRVRISHCKVRCNRFFFMFFRSRTAQIVVFIFVIHKNYPLSCFLCFLLIFEVYQ